MDVGVKSHVFTNSHFPFSIPKNEKWELRIGNYTSLDSHEVNLCCAHFSTNLTFPCG